LVLAALPHTILTYEATLEQLHILEVPLLLLEAVAVAVVRQVPMVQLVVLEVAQDILGQVELLQILHKEILVVMEVLLVLLVVVAAVPVDLVAIKDHLMEVVMVVLVFNFLQHSKTLVQP
tara:strand:- start:139 stop:498 length:360 start_codon:yes stop_codon:yes gene_type:complete